MRLGYAHRKRQVPLYRAAGGFSLVELAIALAVIGLLLGATLTVYQGYIRTKAENDTETRKELIRVAMARFVGTNGRLPCPANPALSITNVNSGVENCGSAATTTGARTAGGSNNVLVGSLPYATLNMSIIDGYDGWDSSFTYAVSELLTDVDTFNEGHGVIRLDTRATVGASAVNTPNPRVLGQNGPLVNSYMFAVVSHGPDKRGSYTNAGIIQGSCVGGGLDAENCNGDATFLKAPRVYVSGANFYDDAFVLTDYVDAEKDTWYQAGMSRVWDPVADEEEVRYSAAANLPPEGTAVIGHEGDQERTDRLWVDSSARANALHVDEVCDASGSNCYRPSLLGGASDNCNGSLVVGISQGKPVCASRVRQNGVTTNCPNGVRAYCSGLIWCWGAANPCP